MPKPVCVPCQRFYRPEKNGFLWVESMPQPPVDMAADLIPRGNEPGADEIWTDYKLWLSDKWKCDGCGHEIVVGHAFQPASEHYLPTFKGVVKEAEERMGAPLLRVNDC